jgi:hypothetical protein
VPRESSEGAPSFETHREATTPKGVSAIQGISDSRERLPIAPSDSEQVSEAVDRLGHIPEIQADAWQGLDSEKRLEALKNVEETMAEIQKRPAAAVTSEPMERETFGYFNGKIHVSAEKLGTESVAENVDTVVHEGRHAYQIRSIDNPGFHGDRAQVKAWAENWADYKDPQFDIEEYANQPLESDARNYASAIRSGLYGNL